MEIWKKVDEKAAELVSILEDLRSSNDVQKYIDNSEGASLLLDEIFTLFNGNESELKRFEDIDNLVKNFETIVCLYFMDSDSIAKFRRLTLPQTEIILITDFFSKQKDTSQMIEFTKKYGDLMLSQPTFLKIFFVIKYTFQLITLNKGNKIDKYNDLFSNMLSEVDSSPATPENKGELLLISLYIFHGYIPANECISKFGSKLYKDFRAYMKFMKSESNDFSIFERLFETIVLDELRMNEYGSKEVEQMIKNDFRISNRITLSHYTSIESLYYILKSSQLKFSRLDRLNDLNENKLLYSGENQVYVFSLTEEHDDLSLFGNYTKQEGLSIQFDLGNLSNAISGVAYANDENFGYTLADNCNVFYDSYIKVKYDKILQKVQKRYKMYILPRHLSHALSRIKRYINYFCKDAPWKYEKEWRIAIPYANDMDRAEFRSGNYNDKEIYLNFNPKSLIVGLVLGPSISNSEYKKKQVNDILEEFGMGSIQVLETSSKFKIS